MKAFCREAKAGGEDAARMSAIAQVVLVSSPLIAL